MQLIHNAQSSSHRHCHTWLPAQPCNSMCMNTFVTIPISSGTHSYPVSHTILCVYVCALSYSYTLYTIADARHYYPMIINASQLFEFHSSLVGKIMKFLSQFCWIHQQSRTHVHLLGTTLKAIYHYFYYFGLTQSPKYSQQLLICNLICCDQMFEETNEQFTFPSSFKHTIFLVPGLVLKVPDNCFFFYQHCCHYQQLTA